MIYASCSKFSEKLKHDTKFSVGQGIFELLIELCNIGLIVLIHNSRSTVPIHLNAIFEFSHTICFRMRILVYMLTAGDSAQKNVLFFFPDAVPP